VVLPARHRLVHPPPAVAFLLRERARPHARRARRPRSLQEFLPPVLLVPVVPVLEVAGDVVVLPRDDVIVFLFQVVVDELVGYGAADLPYRRLADVISIQGDHRLVRVPVIGFQVDGIVELGEGVGVVKEVLRHHDIHQIYHLPRSRACSFAPGLLGGRGPHLTEQEHLPGASTYVTPFHLARAPSSGGLPWGSSSSLGALGATFTSALPRQISPSRYCAPLVARR